MAWRYIETNGDGYSTRSMFGLAVVAMEKQGASRSDAERMCARMTLKQLTAARKA